MSQNNNFDLASFFLELSSPIRIQIMNMLSEGIGFRNSQISKSLNISAQESFRHLSRLSDVGLIHQREKKYELSPTGVIILESIFPQLEFLIKNQKFFLDHDLTVLPQAFTVRFAEIAEAEIIEGVNEIIALAELMIENAEKYFYDIAKLVTRSTNQLLAQKQKKTENFEIKRIEEEKIKKLSFIPDVSSAETKKISNIDLSLVVTDKEAYIRFPNDSGEISLTQVLYSQKPIFINFVKDVFFYYWEQSSSNH